ncbi:MAG: hypothetical protein IPM98_12340 [Lewinellaceae bacterium]|nr:hypothetical protein [Lewinellaceae bacterium]
MFRLLFFFLPALLPAQDLLDLVPRHYCQYWGDTLETELYRFEPNESVPQAVQRILGWAGCEANFELAQSNASSVAAVLDGERRYLLYSQYFFHHVPNPAEAYALLAHEIGHHLNEHRFDSCCRRGEELEADRFMGHILFRSNFSDSLQTVGMADWRHEGAGFSGHPLPARDRRAAIAQGWTHAETAVRARESLAFYDNKSNAEMAGLKAFPWPPPACAQRYTILENASERFATLGDVNKWLRKALDNRHYWSRSYHYLPNGFALVTRLEQFNTDGTCMAEEQRWVDYPVGNLGTGILDYLYTLFAPRIGYYRLFVFAVTDRATGSSGTGIERRQAQKWLDDATSNLPFDIGKRLVSERHFVEVLVYEFETSDSNLRPKQRCSGAKPCREHLERAGLKF